MIKRIFLGLALSSLMFTGTASAQTTTVEALLAQITALQAQIVGLQQQLAVIQSGGSGEPTTSTGVPDRTSQRCVIIAKNLYPGHPDNSSITKLQEFLKSRPEAKWPTSAKVSGYYGAQTQGAVGRFQAYHGVVTSGTPETTGFGAVGRTTRALVQKLSCGDDISVPPVPTDNKPPVISGVSAPTVLSVGQTGTWTVNAYDPEQGVLSYSVIWGDEGQAIPASATVGQMPEYYQSTTFSHSYSLAGTYQVVIYVKDNSGQLAKTSATVKVGDISNSPRLIITSPNGGETWTIGSKVYVQFKLANVPAGAVLGLFLSDGPTNGQLYLYGVNPMIPDGIELTLPSSIIQGDVGQQLVAGKYRLSAVLYDKMPCLGLCALPNSAKVLTQDYSDGYFQIVSSPSSSFTVLTPNGGEKWMLNAYRRISWSPDSNSSVVDAYLERGIGGGFVTVGKIIESGKGSIMWDGNINSLSEYAPVGDGYYVRIVDKATGAWDRSNAPFSIVPADYVKVDLKINGSDGPIVVPPNGANVTLSWTSQNATSCDILINSEYREKVAPSGVLSVFLPGDILVKRPYVNIYCTSPYGDRGDSVWLRGVVTEQGSISISNSNAVPAQNIGVNLNNHPLGGFEVEVKGEAISVKSLVFQVNVRGTGGQADDIDNISLVNLTTGQIVAGPKDAILFGDKGSVIFTDTVSFPVGKNTYVLRGKLSSDFTSDQTIQVLTTPSSDWSNPVGQASGNTITIPSGLVTMSVMTVKAGSLTVVTDATSPSAKSVFPGAWDVEMTKLKLLSTNETIRLTHLALQFDGSVAAGDIEPISIYDGATKIGGRAFPNGFVGTFLIPLATPLEIPKDTSKVLRITADFLSTAVPGHTVAINFDAQGGSMAVGLASGSEVKIYGPDTAAAKVTIVSSNTATGNQSASSFAAIQAAIDALVVQIRLLSL